MNSPKYLWRSIVLFAILAIFLTEGNTNKAGAAKSLAQSTASPTAGPLVSDFTPCTGAQLGQANVPQAGRALMAHSTNGIDFQRPANPKDGFLIDRAGVTDGVVLPSGRLLIYFVDGCNLPDPAHPERSGVDVAISDKQGEPGSWVFKYVRFAGIPKDKGPYPVDPNVVLMPDGSLRMFATVFWEEGGSGRNGAYSFTSTDGGLTFTYEGERYRDVVDPENYRFSDTNWQIITGGPNGYAMSTDGGNIFKTLGAFPERVGAAHEIAVTDNPGEYRVYFSSPTGIKSFISTAAPWTTWTQEPGYRLQVDESTGLESCELSFPTVTKLGPGNYLMVYLTVIPGCECGKDPTICR